MEEKIKMTVKFITGQILAVLGYIVYYASRYCKEKKKMLVVETCSKSINVLSFMCIGNTPGMMSNFITMIRGILIYLKEKRGIKSSGAFILLLSACIISGILTYKNIFSLFAYIAAVITTASAWFGNPQQIRKWGILAGTCYLVFQISIFNITGAIFEAGTILTALSSYIIYQVEFNKNHVTKPRILPAADSNK